MNNFKIYGAQSGKSLLKITKDGDDKYNTITNHINLQINKILQKNFFLNKVNDNNTLILDSANNTLLTFSGLSENPLVTYNILSSSNKDNSDDVCIIVNNNILPLNAGVCIIEAVSSETKNYLSTKSNQIAITIFRKEQPIINGLSTINIDYNDHYQIEFEGGREDLEFVYKTTNDNCVILSGTVVGVKAGTCLITAYKYGNTNYNDAHQTFSIVVNKIYQPNLFLNDIAVNNKVLVNLNKTYPLVVNNILENANVYYIATDPNICIIKDNQITCINVGYCEIHGLTQETDNYLSTYTNKILILVEYNTQAELIITPSDNLYYSSSIHLNYTGGSTDNTIQYVAKTPNCKIQGNTVIGLNAGICRIKGTKPGNNLYKPISDYLELIIYKIQQPSFIMMNINDTNTIYVNPDFPHILSYNLVLDNAKVVFKNVTASSNINLCNINSTNLYAINAGVCLLQAIALETDNYYDTSSTVLTINILKNNQSPLNIIFTSPINLNDTIPLQITGGNSNVAATATPIVNHCTISNFIITGVHAGFCPILIVKGEDFMYNTISSTIYVEVLQINQPNIYITDINETNEIEVNLDISYNLSVSNTKENPTIVYDLVSETPNDSSLLHVVQMNKDNTSFVAINAGTCVFKATTLITDNYLKTTTPPFTVNIILQSPANFIVDKIPVLYYNSSINITVNGGTYDNTAYSIDCSDNNLIIQDNKITALKANMYTLNITKLKTNIFNELKKKIMINAYKIIQPVFQIIDISNTVFVDISNIIQLKTNNLSENPTVIFNIVNQIPLSNNSVAELSTISGKIRFINEGSITLNAFCSSTTNYSNSYSQNLTINVIKRTQPPIYFGNINKLYTNSTVDINVYGGISNSNFIFQLNNNNAYLSGTKLCGSYAGSVTLTAIKKGNSMFYDTQASITLIVYKVQQNITLLNINNNIITYDATASNDIIISGIKENANIIYNIVNKNPDNIVCSVSNNKLYTLNTGQCTLQVTTQETSNYLSTSSNIITINVIKRSDNDINLVPTNVLYYGSQIKINLITNNSDSIVTVQTNNNNCTVSGDIIIGNNHGSCVLTVTQIANDTFEQIIQQYFIFINKAMQNIILNDITLNNIIYLNSKPYYDIVVTNVKEDAIIKFEIIDILKDNVYITPCYIQGNRLYTYTDGACYIEVHTTETANYEASVSNRIFVQFFKQEHKYDISSNYYIEYNSTLDLNYLGKNFRYTLENDNCFIINNIIFAKKTGITKVTVSLPGNNNYSPFKTNFFITITKIKQKIVLKDINDGNMLVNRDFSFPVVIDNLQESPIITYIISDDTICNILNNKIYAINEGVCTIYATTSETTNYSSTNTNTITITVNKNVQSNISILKPNDLFYQSSIDLITVGGSTDSVPIYSSEDTNVCTIMNNTVIALSAKTCKIDVIKPGNFMYYDISSQVIIHVLKINQINFKMNNINSTNTIYVNPHSSSPLSTTAVNDNANVIYKIISESPPCSINGNKLIPLNAGTCTIQAISLESNNYLETVTESITITIIKNEQTELIINYPTTISYNDSFNLEQHGGNTSSPVIFSVDNTNCIIDASSNELTAKYCGTTNLTAFKDGDFMYNPIQKIVTITITKIQQKNISIKSLNATNEIEVNPDVPNNLTIANFGDNPEIIYKIVTSVINLEKRNYSVSYKNTTVCDISNSNFYALHAGYCIINARLLETDNYLETVTPDIKIKIRLKKPSEYNIDTLKHLYYQSFIFLTINGGYYDSNIFQIDTDNTNIRLEKNKIFGLQAGQFSLTITKKATEIYDALSKNINGVVLKIDQTPVIITDVPSSLIINPFLNIKLKVNQLMENPLVRYEIVSNNPISGNQVNVCSTISDNIIIALNEGTCTLKAYTSHTLNYNSAVSNPFIITVSKQTQLPLFFRYSSFPNVNSYKNFYADGGSISGNITYLISNSNCHINNNNLYGNIAGQSIITAVKPGNSLFYDISASITVNILKATQHIQINNIKTDNILSLNSNIRHKLTCFGAREDPLFIFKSSNESVCSIFGDELITNNIGTCIIQGTASETNNYYTSVTEEILINVVLNPASSITIIPSDILYLNSYITLNIYPDNSDDQINKTTIIPSNDVCNVYNNSLHGKKIGYCMLKITCSFLSKYDTIKYYYVYVNKIQQNVTLQDITFNNSIYINPNVSYNLAVSNVLDNALVTYNIIDNGVNSTCQIVENKIYAFNSGYCTVQAQIYETANYTNSYSNKIIIQVLPEDQNKIVFTSTNVLYYKQKITLDLYFGKSEWQVTYSVNNNNCIILNNVLIAKSAGSCILTAKVSGNHMYNNASKDILITINKIYQDNLNLSDINTSNTIEVNPNDRQLLIPTGIAENALYQFYCTDETICIFQSNYIVPIGAGVCQIYYITNDTQNYLSTKSPSISITVNKKNQANLSVIKNPNILYFQSSLDLLISGGSTFTDPILTSSTNSCKIIDNTIIGINYGVSIINITKPGNFMYNPIVTEISILVNKISQSNFILYDIKNVIYVDPLVPIKLSTSAVNENSKVLYFIVGVSNVINITGDKFFAEIEGTCHIIAKTLETDNYLPTESNIIKITVIKKNQDELVTDFPANIDYNSVTFIKISGGNTDAPYVITPNDSNCSVDSHNRITALAAGNSSITIFKAGNYMYNPIQTTIFVTINKIFQSTFSVNKFNETNDIFVDPFVNKNFTFTNLKENAKVSFIVLDNIPNLPKYKVAAQVFETQISGLNAGYVKLAAVLSETTNFLPTNINNLVPFIVNIKLQSPADFIIDRIPVFYYNTTVAVTVNNGLFSLDDYVITCDSEFITINKNYLSGLQAGQYNVTITKNATFMYDSLSKTIKVNVLKIEQPSFDIIGIPNLLPIDSNKIYLLNVNNTLENPVINYQYYANESTFGPVVSIFENNLSVNYFGSCSLYAETAETTNYKSCKSNIFTIQTNKIDQKILTYTISNKLYINSSVNIDISGGNTDNTIRFSVNNTNCYVIEDKIFGNFAGESIITCTKLGNYMYNDISINIYINILKIQQNITFADIISTNTIPADPSRGHDLIITGVKDNAPIVYNVINLDISSTDLVAIIQNKQLIAMSFGEIILEGIVGETSNYLLTKTKLSVKITARLQKELIIIPSGPLYYNSKIKLNVLGGSTDSDIVIVSQTQTCSVNDANEIVAITAGNCLLTISKDGNQYFEPISINYNITINKIPQNVILNNINPTNSILVNDPNNKTHNYSYDLSLDNIQEFANVIWNIQDNNICVINDNSLVGISPGTCIISATLSETKNYTKTLTNQIVVNVNKRNQLIVSKNSQINVSINDSVFLDISGATTGINPIYISKNTNVCDIIPNTNLLIIKNAGVCSIISTVAGDIATDTGDTQFNIVVNKIKQPNIKFTLKFSVTTLFVNPQIQYPINVVNILEQALYNLNTSDISYNDISGVCVAVDNSLIVAANTGTSQISITTLETQNYLMTESNRIIINVVKNNQANLIVNLNPKILTFNAVSDVLITGGSTIIEPILTSSSPICRVLANKTIAAIGSGLCYVNIFKAGNDSYNSISDIIYFEIKKVVQPSFNIQNINNTNTIFVDSIHPITLTTSTVYEYPTIIYEITSTSSNDSIVTITGNLLYANSSGTITLYAYTLETTNYIVTKSLPIVITINKNDQLPISIICPDTIDYNQSIYITISGGSNNNKPIITTDNSNCIVDNNFMLTGNQVGTCVLTAVKDGDNKYNSVSTTFTINILPIKQKISIKKINETNQLFVNPTATEMLIIDNLQEEANVNFIIVKNNPDNANTNVCLLEKNIITPINAGYVFIKAIAAATTNYLETSTQEIAIHVILKTANDFFIDNIPKLYFNSFILITINNSTFTDEYVITSTSSNIGIQNNKIYGLAAGIYNLTITKKQTFEYKSLAKTTSITVYKADQPNFNIIDLNKNIPINPITPIILKTNLPNETNTVVWEIVSNIPLNGNTVGHISLNNFYAINEGTCSIVATSGETNNYNKTKASIFINIIKNIQSDLLILALPNMYFNSSIPIYTVGGSSINSVQYQTSSNCSITNGLLTGISAGPAKVTAMKYGDNIYLDISSSITFTVNKIEQQCILSNIKMDNKIYVNSQIEYPLIVTNIKENASITYVIDQSNNCCTISNNNLIPISSGICTIQAIISETTNYLKSKTNKIKITIEKIPQNELIINTSTLYYQSYTNIIISGGSNDGKISITTDNNNCTISNTISGYILYGNSVGPCNLSITKDGDQYYFAVNKNLYIYVYKIPQSITLNNINGNNIVYVDPNPTAPYQLLINNLQDNASFTYYTTDSSCCYIKNNNSIIPLSAGSCQIYALTTETDKYLSTQTPSITITVKNKTLPIFDLNIISEINYGDEIKLNEKFNNYTINYSTDNNNCIVINNVLIGANAGICGLTATVTGSPIYNNIVNKYYIQVLKINQPNLLISFPKTTFNVNPNIQTQITVQNVYDKPRYIWNYDSTLCSIDQSNNFIALNEGTCDISLTTSETDNILEATSNIIKITIIKNKQSKLSLFPSDILLYRRSIELRSIGGSSDIEVVFSGDNNVNIMGNTVIPIDCGITKITARKPENFMYEDIYVDIILPIYKAPQQTLIINNINDTNTIFVNPSEPIDITYSPLEENPDITYNIIYNNSNNSNLVKISNGKLYAIKSGSCTISILAAETEHFLQVTSTNQITITINKKAQEQIIVQYPPNILFTGSSVPTIDYKSSFTIQAVGGNTANIIQFTSKNSNICYVDINNKVTGLNYGTTQLTISRDGDTTYLPIQQVITISVNKIYQNNIYISDLNAINTLQVNTKSKYPLNVLNINENPIINYTILDSSGNIINNSNNNVIYIDISNNTLTPLKPGSVTLIATTSETTNYLQTYTPNNFIITVIPYDPFNFFIDSIPKFNVFSKIAITVNGSWDNSIYSITNYDTNALTISGNSIYGKIPNIYNVNVNNNKGVTQKVKITVKKLDQPKLEITNFPTDIKVDLVNYIPLSFSQMNDNPIITFKIISNNPFEPNVDVCGFYNNKIIGKNSGYAVIKVEASETTYYNRIESVEYTISVSKNLQNNLSFHQIPTIYVNSIVYLSTFGGSTSNNIVYSINNSKATISGNLFTAISPGTCVITAEMDGNYMYEDIKESIVVNINKPTQNITLLDINSNNTINFDPNDDYDYDLVIDGIKEKPTIEYNIINTSSQENFDICTIEDNKLRTLNAGECIIQATISETESYKETTTNQIKIKVDSINQSGLIVTPNKPLLYNSSVTLNVTGGNTNEPIAIISNSLNCTVSGNIIYGIKSGLCCLSITKEGDDKYETLYTDYYITVHKIPQKLIINDINDTNSIYANNYITLQHSPLSENSRVLYKIISGDSIAYISNNILYGVDTGTCKIQATSTETNNYLKTNSNVLTVTILKKDQQNLVIDATNNINFNDSIILNIFGDLPNLNIKYLLSNNNCKIINNTLIGLHAGECDLTVISMGDSQVNSITKQFKIYVNKIPQKTVNLQNITDTNILKVNPNILNKIFVTGTLENPNYNYILSNNSICSISNNNIIALAEGTTTLQVIAKETNNYLATYSNVITIKIIKNTQSNINITLANRQLDVFNNTSLIIDGGSATISSTIQINNYNIDISNNIVYARTAGTSIITVYNDGDFMYNPISSSINLTINKIYQNNFSLQDINQNNIIFINPAIPIPITFNQVNENASINYRITDISFSDISNDQPIVTILQNNIYANVAGTCKILATTSETINYLPTNSIRTINLSIIKNPQNPLIFTLTPNIENISINDIVYINVSGGNTINPITFTYSSDISGLNISKLCHIDETNKLIIDLSGNLSNSDTSNNIYITATKQGNTMWMPVQKRKMITILHGTQSNAKITKFNQNNELFANSPPRNLTVESVKGSPIITFSSSNSTICSISGNVLIPKTPGKCTITAGISPVNIYAYTTITMEVTVLSNNSSEFIIDTVSPLYYNSSVKLTFNNGNYDNTYTIKSISGNISISGNTVSGLAAGNCIINITKNSITKTITTQVLKINQPTLTISTDVSNCLVDSSRNIIYSRLNESPILQYKVVNNVSISNSNVCDISNNKLIAVNEGIFSFTVTALETKNYNSIDSSNILTINVSKKNQDPLKFNTLLPLYYNNKITVSAYGGNSLQSIKYSTTTSSICSISGNIVSGNYCGQFTIIATKAGDRSYYDTQTSISGFVLTISQNISVNLRNIIPVNSNPVNTIYINTLNDLIIDNIADSATYSFVITPIGSLNSSQNKICDISNNKLYAVSPGKCQIHAIINKTNNYIQAITNKITVTVILLDQNQLIVNSTPNILYFNSSITLTISGGSTNDQAIINNNSSGTGICSISGNVIYGVQAGSCSLTIYKKATNIYNYVYTNYNIVINKINQKSVYLQNITSNNLIYISANSSENSYPINIINKNENPTITYQITFIDVSNNCYISNNKLYPVKAGSCTIYAKLSETTNYLAATTNSIHVVFLKNKPSNLLLLSPTTVKFGDIITLAININSPVVYTTSDNNLCSISSNILTTLAVGSFTLTVKLLATSLYDETLKDFTMTISKIYQKNIIINNINSNNTIYVNDIKNILISNLQENPNITYNIKTLSSTDTSGNICNIANNKLYAVAAGSVSLGITLSETNSYLKTDISNNLIINIIKKPALNLTSINSIDLNYDDNYPLTFSGNPIITLDSSNCIIDSSNTLLYGNYPGICNMKLEIPGNQIYLSSVKIIPITVRKIVNTDFTISTTSNTFFVDVSNNPSNSYPISISGLLDSDKPNIKYKFYNSSNNLINYGNNIVIINNNNLSAVGEGTLNIVAFVKENRFYLDSSSNSITVRVQRINQTPLIVNLVSPLNYGYKSLITISGGNIKQTYFNIQLAKGVTTNNVALSSPITTTSTAIIGLAAGVVKITAYNMGNFKYLPCQSTPIIVTVNRISQPKNAIIILPSTIINKVSTLILYVGTPVKLSIINARENAQITKYYFYLMKNSQNQNDKIAEIKIESSSTWYLNPLKPGNCVIYGSTSITKNYLESYTSFLYVTIFPASSASAPASSAPRSSSAPRGK